MNDLYIYSYDYYRLAFIVLVTFLSFYWVKKVRSIRIKIWYVLMALFIFIYSAIGGAISEVNSLYCLYYAIYVASLGGTLAWFYKRKIKAYDIKVISEGSSEIFLPKTASRLIIIFYFLTLLFPLVYPEFKLGNLINPPTPSLEGLHYSKFVEGEQKDFISSIVYLISQLLLPFFYLCAYKYRKSPLKILLLFLLPVYLDLCNRGIFGRGEMMLPILIVGFGMFEEATPRVRRIIMIMAGVAIPIFSIILVQFAMLRIGRDLDFISATDAMQILFGQEIAYPLHFNEYYGAKTPLSIADYFLWLILLPFPGFLKFGYGDPQINLIFTIMVTGLDPTESLFSIALPGLTGEGIFVFGNYLFPLHAVILAILVSIMIKYLFCNNSYKYIFYYAALLFSYIVCRGGTMSAYSFFFKQFLLFVIVMYFVSGSKHKKKSRV